MLFDSHAHLDDEKFDADRDEVICGLKNDGVAYVVNVGASLETSVSASLLAEKYDFIYASAGVHPEDAAMVNTDTIEKLSALAKKPKVVAIGEAGLDYYYEGYDKKAQASAFIQQIELANALSLPIIIHNRDSHADLIDILKNHRPESAIIHCFSGSLETAKILLGMGYFISFSGTVTFKNAKKLAETAAYVPDDMLLIETDCPYLSPEPERGTRNHSGKVKYVAARLAELRNTDFENISRITLDNAKRIYGIK